MESAHYLFPRHGPFSCEPPSVRDDEGNCIDFQNQKWDLQGPKTLLLIGFIISVLAGCWTLVFIGSEARAKKRHHSVTAAKGFKNHSLTGAQVLALIYFIVDAYLRFLQFQQRTLNIGSILLDLARTKPQGAGDWIVLNIILFNKDIHAISGGSNGSYFNVSRTIFTVLFTASDLASAVGDIYTRSILAIDIASKGSTIKKLSEIIPRWVTTILSAFDTVAYSLIFLAGIYFITVALKCRIRGRDKVTKRYISYYTTTAVAFLIRSIPGLVLCIMSDWFDWTRTYRMNFLNSTVYAITTCMIFYFWTRLAKTPIDFADPNTGASETIYNHASDRTGYKQPTFVYTAVDSGYDGRF